MKRIIIIIIGILSGLYLINPTAGFFELIPDNLPMIGNLDEATATTLLLASLSYFGIDLTRFFKREEKKSDKKK
jgi:uncharacterized membrane protein YkvA (DUF1232 family)